MTRSRRSLVSALLRPLALLSLLAVAPLALLNAQTLSTSRDINFYRDVPSRSLKGLAARSDGLLLNGPHISPPLDVPLAELGADLLWSAAKVGQTLYIGTGPEGKILRFDLSGEGAPLSPVSAISLPQDSHVLALAALPDGSLLAGSSPEGALSLIKGGEVIARAVLPVGSIFSIEINATYEGNEYALVGTGSPARIYRINLAAFRTSGVQVETPEADAEALAERGITLWATVRDEAIRSLLQLPDGRIIAGSAPKGNVYEFNETGGSPRVLSENTNAEVTSLLAWEGGFFAALTTGDTARRAAQVARGSSVDSPRPSSSRDAAAPAGGSEGSGGGDSGEGENTSEGNQAGGPGSQPHQPLPTANVPKFSGSSQLLWFPDGGYPEVAGARQGVGFYQLARHGDLVLITAGDEGELLGYDPKSRLGMVFAGATASQVNGILPLPVAPPAAKAPPAKSGSASNASTPPHKGPRDSFLLIGNNPATLELMHFDDGDERSATTRRIDLGSPAELGALRFPELSDDSSVSLQVELRTSESSDPLEGWGSWESAAQSPFDMGGYRAERGPVRGRYVQFRFTARGPGAHAFNADSPRLYLLPQNQRPQLANFTVLPISNARTGTESLRKLAESTRGVGYREDLAAANDTPLYRTTRVIVWDLNDANGDALLSTLSIRGPGDASEWQPVLVDSAQRYAIFSTEGMPEGRYRTRLEVRETAPRPAEQRLSVTFEGEPFVVDHSPPEILMWEVLRNADSGLHISLVGHDLDSLLLGAEIRLNNGKRYEFTQTLDGILDGKRETFVLELNADEVGPSTQLEATVIDAHYNTASHRIPIPPKE